MNFKLHLIEILRVLKQKSSKKIVNCVKQKSGGNFLKKLARKNPETTRSRTDQID